MFELKNKVQLCLTTAERSKCIKEFENIFCKVDPTTSSSAYSLDYITNNYPTISELFQLMEKL